MSYEWWIIGFLVWWMLGTYAALLLCDSKGWERRDIHFCVGLGWTTVLILIVAGVVAMYEQLQDMWHEGWEKYGPDRAMEKEDQ